MNAQLTREERETIQKNIPLIVASELVGATDLAYFQRYEATVQALEQQLAAAERETARVSHNYGLLLTALDERNAVLDTVAAILPKIDKALQTAEQRRRHERPTD